jgi:hypothetical protein
MFYIKSIKIPSPYFSLISNQHRNPMKFLKCLHYFIVKEKSKSRTNRRQSANASTVNNMDTPEPTAATNPDAFAAEQIISQLLARTHAMLLRNALTVLKTTQLTTRATQFIKNSNVVRNPAHQVINYKIILISKPLMYKVTIHLFALSQITPLLKRKLTLRLRPTHRISLSLLPLLILSRLI